MFSTAMMAAFTDELEKIAILEAPPGVGGPKAEARRLISGKAPKSTPRLSRSGTQTAGLSRGFYSRAKSVGSMAMRAR